MGKRRKKIQWAPKCSQVAFKIADTTLAAVKREARAKNASIGQVLRFLIEHRGMNLPKPGMNNKDCRFWELYGYDALSESWESNDAY